MTDHVALTRRGFIQTTAAASAWLAAPGALGRVLGANERLNLAVIGTGGMGTAYFGNNTIKGV